MVTIDRIPSKARAFFRPLRNRFSQAAWDHFWGLVLAICISHGTTVERLAALLRGSTHRTNHGEFYWRSDWEESAVLQAIALDTLKRLHRKKDRRVFFILDDTQTLKRAKKMDAVGKLFHHATGTYGQGHTILKACLYYRGVTIPWGSWIYIKKEQAKGLQQPFRKLTELAAEAIRQASIPEHFHVTVLFDAFYLCPRVVHACRQRHWHFISVGKSNRRFTVGSLPHQLGRYGRNLLRRRVPCCAIQGLRKRRTYRLTARIGHLSKIGTVKVVFSRRHGERNLVALVTDQLGTSARSIVAAYLKRWAIELLIKDEKQHLGLGDYRMRRYQAVVRHLHLVDIAYACLTHVGLTAARAQGQQTQTKKELRLEPIRQLKERMHRMLWQDAVHDVVRHSHEKPVIRRLEKLLAA